MYGVDLGNYKMVPPNYIAFVADTSRRGDKMSPGFNKSDETFLVSSISTVFNTKVDRHYDYLFNRCLSLIAVAIQYLK